MKHLRIYGSTSAMLLIALTTLLILLVIQDARSEPRPTETVPAEAKVPAVEKASEPSTKASKDTRKSAYEKLALNKLDIEEPASTPKPEREPEKEPEHLVKAGAANVSVLPGPARKAPTPKAPAPKASAPKAPVQKAPDQKIPEQ